MLERHNDRFSAALMITPTITRARRTAAMRAQSGSRADYGW